MLLFFQPKKMYYLGTIGSWHNSLNGPLIANFHVKPLAARIDDKPAKHPLTWMTLATAVPHPWRDWGDVWLASTLCHTAVAAPPKLRWAKRLPNLWRENELWNVWLPTLCHKPNIWRGDVRLGTKHSGLDIRTPIFTYCSFLTMVLLSHTPNTA